MIENILEVYIGEVVNGLIINLGLLFAYYSKVHQRYAHLNYFK
jgi:hypothetical protein